MNFEPQKFFIGLMDFCSILLPGTLCRARRRASLGHLGVHGPIWMYVCLLLLSARHWFYRRAAKYTRLGETKGVGSHFFVRSVPLGVVERM